MLKADLLNVNFNDPAAAGFGASQQSVTASDFGGMIGTGYRFSISRQTFVEPLASFAFVGSHMGGLSIGGSQISFANSETTRGRLGVRLGATLSDTQDVLIEASTTASYWGRLSGGPSATFNSGVGAPLLNIADRQATSYGELGLALNFVGKTNGWSGFVSGDLQLANGSNSGTVRAGLRRDF